MQQSETLFADIATSRLEEQFPAAGVIYDLVQHIGTDVSSFRRNPQTSYRLVELARDLHDEINKKIKYVEASGDWDAYDTYTQAIDPLEELLFSIVPVADEEQDEYLTAASSVEECKQSIEKWIKNRKLIRAGLKDLRTSDKLKTLIPAPNDNEDDIFGAYTHDDHGFLNNLLSEIKANASNIHRRRTKALLEKVALSLENIQNLPIDPSKKSVEEELCTLSIKCAMIVYGVTKIITERSATPELLDHYHSDAVWSAAQKLVDDVFQGLKSQKSTIADLEAKYSAFENTLLQISTIETPEAYRRLIQLIGKIGRAYHAQSLVLVLLCREAVAHFQNNKSMKNYDAVENALEETVKALKAATRVAAAEANILSQGATEQANTDATSDTAEMESIASSSSIGSDDFATEEHCTKLFEDSVNALKGCFEEIGLEGKVNPRESLDAAREKDRARVEQVKEKLAGRPTRRELVTVTINVFKGDQRGNPITIKTCRVPSACRLSFIKWSVAKELPNIDLSNPETSYFETPSTEDKQTTRIPLNESIQTLSNGGEISLRLIVDAEESKDEIEMPGSGDVTATPSPRMPEQVLASESG